MKKRILSLFAMVCMLAALLPVLPAAAVDMGKVGEFQTISAGEERTAAIKPDGSLWVWGYNSGGQLGDGTTEDKTSPIKIMDNVVAVSAGWGVHTAAIKTDGSLWTWGYNSCGQLGDDTRKDKTSPIKIMDNVTVISAGSDYTVAIKTDGSLWTWGYNGRGRLGDGTTVEKISPVKIMDNVVAISAGSSHAAAIKTDGSLWTWGDNSSGQLGDGTTENKTSPIKIMDNVVAISAGSGHTAAIKTDGSLWIWGKNKYGQLGDGTTEYRYLPIKIMDNVATVSAGWSHSTAIKTDGSLWAWGSNYRGQLGDGTTEDRSTPIKIMDDVKLPRDVQTAIVETTPAPAEESEPEPAPQNTVTTSFGATVSDWAAPEIELAYENNLIPEVMVDFDLTQKVNRGEFAAIALQLYDVLENTETPLPASCPFTDIAGDVNEIAIKKASSLDITNGTSATTFEPVSFITREQLATMLCRVIKKYGFEGWTLATDSDYYMNTDGAVLFADDADISDWAKPSVYYMSLHGIIKGVDETHFAPKNTTTQQEASGYASATREQAIILAQRIFTKSDMLGNLN